MSNKKIQLKDKDGNNVYPQLVKQCILDVVYPVGSIYISVNSTSPQTLFGGTWEAFGQGRCLVGVDTSQEEFNTVLKTGGSKYLQKHSHNGQYYYDNNNNKIMNAGVSAGGNYMGLTLGGDSHSISSSVYGTGDSGNLQPYITVYFYKRTA